MRKLSFTTIVFLILLGITVEPHTTAQNRRRRSRPRPAITKISEIEEIDMGTPEEQAKIIEACLVPDRPKPEVEVGMSSNALLCGRAISLPKPSYPEEAKAQKIAGLVSINIVIDEKGRAIWAKAIEGHPLLQDAALKSACRVRYSPI
jgi:TonB family protein